LVEFLLGFSRQVFHILPHFFRYCLDLSPEEEASLDCFLESRAENASDNGDRNLPDAYRYGSLSEEGRL
jgi:hypothetical protein